MNKTRKKSNHLVLALVVAAGLALPVGALAQGGVFGRAVSDETYYGFGGGMLPNRDGVSTTGVFSNQNFGHAVGAGNVTNQTFGGIFVRPDNITNQTFGTPLGSGALIMLAAGAGYATLKNRKRNKKNK